MDSGTGSTDKQTCPKCGRQLENGRCSWCELNGDNPGDNDNSKGLLQAIIDIPGKILDGLKSALAFLFVPQEDYLTVKYGSLQNKIKGKFNIDVDYLNSIKNTKQKGITDLNVNIMGAKGKILDSSFLANALNTIRPWIQSFIFLRLLIYNTNQIYFLFRGTKLFSIENTIGNIRGEK